MQYRQLGRTELKVSAYCLGSMTWGTQTSESDAHAQIEYALDHGVNFIDTAEMYPTNPLSKETQGDTERILGSWMGKHSSRRAEVILATKVAGSGYKNVRDGAPISPATITEALHNSLESLQTDYVDLYQLHWPNRGSYMFRQNWTYDPSPQDTSEVHDHMMAVLDALNGHIKAGKIRHIGLSNETAWGVMQWLKISGEHNLPRMVSTQNEYSLLCRLYDTDLAEVSHHEQVGLLAYSPLGTGLLTGKYKKDLTPDLSRRSINADMGGRINDRIWRILDSYLEIAKKHNLNPIHMAMGFCLSKPFVSSAIFGATNLEQLKVILEGSGFEISKEVLTDLNQVNRNHPLPY